MQAGSDLSGGLGRSMEGNSKEKQPKESEWKTDQCDRGPKLAWFLLFADWCP